MAQISASTSSEINRRIHEQLAILRRTKVSQLEDDSIFTQLNPSIDTSIADPNVPFVVIFESESTSSMEFMHTILGFELPLLNELSLIRSGDSPSEMSISPKDFSSSLGLDESETINSTCRRIQIPKCQLLTSVRIVYVPQKAQVSPALVKRSSASLVILPISNPDIPSHMKTKIMLAGNNNPRIIISIGDGHFLTSNLPRIIWSISRLLSQYEESPKFHFFIPSRGVDDIIQDLLTLPNRFLLASVLSFLRLAKQVRCHAAIVAYMKSQLPVFNRQAKQDQLVTDLRDNLSIIAAKYNVPISDFALLIPDLGRLREFDFTKARKLRDNSLSTISELIDNDIEKILRLIPHKPEDLIMHASAQVNGGQSFTRSAPRIADYIDDFKSLSPQNGLLDGAFARDHLVGVSRGLPHKTLHKIWKLADQDKDGKLNLAEYTVVRDLIQFAQENDISKLPRILPTSFFPS